MSIEIANESGVDVDESHLGRLARHVLDDMRVHPLAELSVLLVDEPAMTELHVRWMGEEGPTDVLAFPMDELRLPQPGGTHADHATPDPDAAEVLLGDVVICPQVAAAQAAEADHAVQDEIDLLCTHGILHLLGYDHGGARGARDHVRPAGPAAGIVAGWPGRRARRPRRAGVSARGLAARRGLRADASGRMVHQRRDRPAARIQVWREGARPISR